MAVALSIGTGGSAQPVSAVAVDGAANPTIATHIVTQAGRPHQLVVVDSSKQVIAVYQINPTTGEISLSSVRKIVWDLQMEELNSKRILPPKDIREALKAAG